MKPDLAAVVAYYERALAEHGATARGVDWNSEASQRLRFDQFARMWYDAAPQSINDFGCGFGALLTHLRSNGVAARYTGFDVSSAMIETARRVHAGDAHATFATAAEDLPVADFTVASGVFHIKLATADEVWWQHVADTLDLLRDRSRRGFVFNLLTAHSDPERRQRRLYYADPAAVWEYCRQRFGRRVALLHDYPLYEFVIGVRVDQDHD